MNGKRKLGSGTAIGLGAALAALVFYACVSSGQGSDFDSDGVLDDFEDVNENFEFDPGETDFVRTETDADTLCDGRPDGALLDCTGCEDCDNDGFWEPCLNETDPLNDDTDNDGIPDGTDPAPLDRAGIDCSQGEVKVPYGASLPSGKPFPQRPTPTPSPAPFPTSTPGPPPTLPPGPFVTPVPTP